MKNLKTLLASLSVLIANAFEGCGTCTLIASVLLPAREDILQIMSTAPLRLGSPFSYQGCVTDLRRRVRMSPPYLPVLVATKMTEAMDLPTKLTAHPVEVANSVYYIAKTTRHRLCEDQMMAHHDDHTEYARVDIYENEVLKCSI